MASPGGIDERKIEEIVARVLDRLGGGPGRVPAPGAAAPPRTEPPPQSKSNLPRGTNGVYADPDQAAT
ncbi:MAG TPA: hypothetical protein VFT22_15900, partial [Kofleriaceae bacterium]|nr:hypothetical protein [Kofleriaceae bacterium]